MRELNQKKQKLRILIDVVICCMLIYSFSMIKLTTKKIDYYNGNANLMTLYDGFNIVQNFDIQHENLDKLIFLIENDNEKETEKKFHSFDFPIEQYGEYERPKIPNINYDSRTKTILFKTTIDNQIFYKRVYINDLDKGYNEVNVMPKIFKGIKYKLINVSIETNNILKKDKISVYTNEKRMYSSSTIINSENVQNEMSCIMINHILDIKLLVIFSFICLLIFVYKNKNYEIFDDRINDFTLFLFDFILSLIFSISLLKFNINFSAYEILSKTYLLGMIISLFLLVKLLLYSINRYKNCLEKLYVVLAIFVGLMYVFTLIPNGAPDENNHYYQVDKLSKLDFSSNEYYSIDKRFDNCTYTGKNYKCINEIFFKAKNNVNNSKKYVVKSTAVGYSPLLYIPAAIGVSIGKILGTNICIGYYIARLFNMLTTILFGYYSLKLLTKGKLILFLYLLNPMYIHQGVAISADVLTNAITMLFISFIFSENKITSLKQKIILSILTISFYIIKRPYIFLLLLFFVKNGNNKKLNKKSLVILFTSLLIFIAVYVIFSNSNYTLYDNYSFIQVLRNPFDFVNILINTLRTNFNYYLETLLGSKLGWLEININTIYIYMYLLLLVFSTIIDKLKFNCYQIFVMLITIILIIGSIIFGFYMVYFEQLEHSILGIQGRYFIQIAIIILYVLSHLLNKININVEYEQYVKISSTLVVIIHFLIICQIVNYYVL